MTVNELIRQLEKIGNKYLEVEVMSPSYNPYSIERIIEHKQNKKVYLINYHYTESND